MAERVPTSLDDLPAGAPQPLGALGPDALRQWAAAAGHRFFHVDLHGCTGKKAVLVALGRAFAFPRWYGANLDALYDCLTDLPDKHGGPGFVVVVENLPRSGAFDADQRAALLDVFGDTIEDFARRGIALRVLYS